MKFLLPIIPIILLLVSCHSNSDTGNTGIIARVGEHILTKEDLASALPPELNSEDSLIITENYIENWIKENLMYDLAKSNINNMDEINQLVDNYKKSLITYQYKEQLINEKMTVQTSDAEMEKYYKENADKFSLETILIKGLFIKVPVDAPQINKIKEWYKSPSIKDIENIEKYSLQNAVNYDYFYDRWVKIDDVMRLFPAPWVNPDALLRQQKQVEVQDSVFCYLLNVKQALFPGDTEPYEYAKPNVREMIINQKRLDFLRDFENDLYRTAVDKRMIKRINN